MSLSRNSSTSDSESLADNDVSCEESIIGNNNNNQHSNRNYKHFVIEQPNSQNVRYLLSPNGMCSQSRNSIYLPYLHGKDNNVLPSVSSCTPQPYVDNNYMYRTYSYIPHYSNQIKNFPQPPPPAPSHLNQPDMAPSMKQPEFVSIRYYAPVNHPNSRLVKGEAINQGNKREGYQRKVSNPNIQFSPSGPIDPSLSFHTNYNPSFTPKLYPQNRSYETGSYRTVNFDASQIQQQNLYQGENGQQLEHNQSFNRPISNMWNITGGAPNSTQGSNINSNQKFLNGFGMDNNNYSHNFYNSNQTNEKSILDKIGIYSNDKHFKNNAKIGAIAVVITGLVLIVAIAVVLAIVLTRSPLTEQQRSMLKSKLSLEKSNVTNINITDGFLLANNSPTVDVNETSLNRTSTPLTNHTLVTLSTLAVLNKETTNKIDNSPVSNNSLTNVTSITTTLQAVNNTQIANTTSFASISTENKLPIETSTLETSSLAVNSTLIPTITSTEVLVNETLNVTEALQTTTSLSTSSESSTSEVIISSETQSTLSKDVISTTSESTTLKVSNELDTTQQSSTTLLPEVNPVDDNIIDEKSTTDKLTSSTDATTTTTTTNSTIVSGTITSTTSTTTTTTTTTESLIVTSTISETNSTSV